MEWDFYLQDDYRLTKNLTVNIGIRNTYIPGFWTKNGINTAFDFKNNARFVMSNPYLLLRQQWLYNAADRQQSPEYRSEV